MVISAQTKANGWMYELLAEPPRRCLYRHPPCGFFLKIFLVWDLVYYMVISAQTQANGWMYEVLPNPQMRCLTSTHWWPLFLFFRTGISFIIWSYRLKLMFMGECMSYWPSLRGGALTGTPLGAFYFYFLSMAYYFCHGYYKGSI